MDLDDFREYCLSKKGVSEDTPFGPETLVFRIGGKLFALTGINSYPPTANLKCDPERAIQLREEHRDITPGYHMNKKHWNTVQLEGNLSHSLLCELIDHSYDLVYQSLPKAIKAELEAQQA